MRTEIQSDGKTVWVHADNGHTIARFGRRGIDVHTLTSDGCLHCTHEPTGLGEWRTFQAKMVEHYGVVVGDEYMPTRLHGIVDTPRE